MKLLVVFDTNVIVSALISSNASNERKLLDYIQNKTIIPLYNNEIIDEYKEVLGRPKFRIRKHLIALFIASIRRFGCEINPKKKTKTNMSDISDIKFYEVVLEKKDEGAKLVTGNIKDFPKEKFIVTPRELLDIIEK